MKKRNYDEVAAKAANDTKPKPRKRLAREHQISDAVNSAEEVRKPLWPETQGKKPRLLVEASSPDETLPVLRDILAAAAGFSIAACPSASPSIRCSRVHLHR